MICKWHGFILPVVFVTQQSDLETSLSLSFSVLTHLILSNCSAVPFGFSGLPFTELLVYDGHLVCSQCCEEYPCTCLLGKHVDLISLITHLGKKTNNTALIWSKAGTLRFLALPNTIILNFGN